MVLEIMPNKIPVRNWIKTIVQKLLTKICKMFRPGKKISIFGLNPQQIRLKIKRQIKKAEIPEIAPWTQNGPRINQLPAPTNLWILISSRKL